MLSQNYAILDLSKRANFGQTNYSGYQIIWTTCTTTYKVHIGLFKDNNINEKIIVSSYSSARG